MHLSPSSREEQLEGMFHSLEEKFHSLNNNDELRLSILTAVPKYWTIQKIYEKFQMFYRLARKARELRKTDSVLACGLSKTGKKLPEETVYTVIAFYENDLNSRKRRKRLLLFDV